MDYKTAFKIGELPCGNKNLITDVPGVKVGHYTLSHGDIQTGVTALIPHPGNTFLEKCMAAGYVINGFGKTTGLIQIEEMGNIETPILLTNTLSVGSVYEASVKYMLSQNGDIGRTTGTVNPVVCECNDGHLNDIRGLHVKEEHVFSAIESAGEYFEQGAVGAGRGMICFQMSGGIGSASRVLSIENSKYVLGALVLTNYGLRSDLLIEGIKPEFHTPPSFKKDRDCGSVIVILATDLPLSERQLKRLCKRVPIGLSRTGSYISNGSGEIVLAFTTANKMSHYPKSAVSSFSMLGDTYLDLVFRAVAEAVEESVLNSLYYAETVTGLQGNSVSSLKDSIVRDTGEVDYESL